MKIAVEKLRPAMKLVDDVRLETGTTLLAVGTVLTDEKIETLKSHGVKQVAIEAPAEEQGGDASAATVPLSREDRLKGISVRVGADSTSADITIDPQANPNLDVTAELLVEALDAAAVVSGIQYEMLADMVTKWRVEKKFYEVGGVARAAAPVPGKDSRLEIQVPCITNPGHLELAKKATYCWELQSSGVKFHRVKPGDLIAKKGPPTPGTPGRDVHGAAIAPGEVQSAAIKADESVELRENGSTAVARTGGLAYFVNDTIGVAAIRFEGSVEVTISGDRMKAELTAHPAVADGAAPTEAAVRDLLKQKGVVFGIKEAPLKDLIEKVSKGTYPTQPVVVAEGAAPVDGQPGHIEFLFNSQSSLQPKRNADGSVDFKEVSLVHAVTAGTGLARRIAPTKGTPGHDVLGNVIGAKDGTEAQLPAGKGSKVSAQDNSLLVAETDGNVRYDGKVVEVTEGFVVEGHVDYSTGNIRYNKSVTIGGDVKAGFEVDCDGDLQVAGVVEDARVKAGGSVLVKAGFVGQGKGLIEAKGDVNIGFVHNQTVRSLGSVSIAKEALDSRIFAKKGVVVLGEPVSAVGGTIVARESIEVRTAGNLAGTKTELQAGIDFSLLDQITQIDKELKVHDENAAKLKKIAVGYEKVLQVRKSLSKKDEALYGKVKATLEKHGQEVGQLAKKKSSLEQEMQKLTDAYIKINHAAMPGTILRIGEIQMRVDEEIAGPKTVRLVKGKIILV